MSESPYILNVSAQNFQALVLENSLKQPVLVDFWADWCEPCKTLMPMLAKLADEYGGKFILAKVNTDQEHEITAHFGIKSLPTTKIFVNGKAVDERIGVLPESEIRAFIDQYITPASNALMDEAMLALDQGRADDALALMNQALAEDPENADLKINMAKVLMDQNDRASALALLDSLSDADKTKDDAIALRAAINLAIQLENIPALVDIEKQLAQNPNDLAALLNQSRHLSARGDYDEAMECLLQVMRTDRQYEEDAGRLGLISLFELLGPEHASVQKYRRKLFTLMH